MKLPRRKFLKSVGVVGLGANGVGTVSGSELAILHVPDDYPTVQAGVDGADSGDLVLIEPGVYTEEIDVMTPNITIRGVDRNDVILDGEFEKENAIHVYADGVAIENMTARHYTENGFYWTGVEGFRGCYLTAHNNKEYGLYAYKSFDGRIEYSYASGHRDSGFYYGHNHPFHAVISDVIAEGNALGYSGTSAGGDLIIKDSIWRNNMAGIVPNTLHPDEPQRQAHIKNNEVRDNNNTKAPAKPLTYPAFGTGILVSGGTKNVVGENEVQSHQNFGIVLKELLGTKPRNNLVRRNTVSGSGEADLGLGELLGPGNRFVENDFSTSLPSDIEKGTVEGSSQVTQVYDDQTQQALAGNFPSGDWQTYPAPGDRPTMADIDSEPLPAKMQFSCGKK